MKRLLCRTGMAVTGGVEEDGWTILVTNLDQGEKTG